MKRITTLCITLFATVCLWAQGAGVEKGVRFEEHFADRTLRVDYIFAGSATEQDLFVRGLSSSDGWYGRRVNMDRLPVEGDGQLTMTDVATGEVIYRTSFASLFQEWITQPEAATIRKAFEFTLQVPMPKGEADISLRLANSKMEQLALLTHRVNPADILIRRVDENSVTPHTYLHRGGSPREAIDVVIVAEGYTAEDMEVFRGDAQATVDAIFSYEPFASHKERFNFVAVESASKDSGVSLPRAGKWRTTAVGSHFDTFYSDRYLTTSNIFALADLLDGIAWEHIIILANTDTYGGGGIYNSYTLTTAHHPLFAPVVVHEFGHSFGGLADEYFYEQDDLTMNPLRADREPWQQNITNLADFESKWADMLSDGTPIPTEPTKRAERNYTVGVYEGGNYVNKGVYRPAVVCRMRDNKATHFCPVCERALERMIQYNVIELEN